MSTPEMIPAFDNTGGENCFPCSATQERCWFLDRLDPGTAALNVAIRWHVTGQFSAAAFEAAFRAVIARHEILRTRFVEQGGRPMQQIMDTADFRLSEIDIRATPVAAQDDRVEAIATESAALPFDLTQPGPIRATLIRMSNDRAILAITVHQICFDGWSIRILGREIGEYAAAFDAGTTADLPDLPLQYCDYALWQQEYFESDAFADDLEPWRARLDGAPYFEVQPDFPRPLERSGACALVKTDLTPAFGARLDAEAKARAMSPFGYGAGVLSAMLSRCAETPEVTIGTQVAGRTEVDLEPLIGVFINNVVLRFPTPETATVGDHLNRAKGVVQDALIGQNVPFNKLVEIVNPDRDASRTPLISVNFILQHAFMETARYGGFELSSAPSHAPGAIYDLSFVLIGRATGWRMTLEYSSDLFDAATAERLLSLWQDAFAFAFDHPDRPLAEMPGADLGRDARDDDAQNLARIETALGAHHAVSDATAVPYRDDQGARRIHGFVAPVKDLGLPLETLPALLADHLSELLPRAVLPDGISVLRDLPRDASGRLVRTRLPLSIAARAAPRRDATPVRDTKSIETRLAVIWADLLGLETVAPSSNFFDLGGHSLLTVRMLAQIEREFGQRLSLATAYRSPTLRALAQHLAGTDSAGVVAQTGADGVGDWRVLDLLPDGSGIPIIGINNARTVYALAEQFADPRPAKAVRIFDASRDEELVERDFEEIAADYADAVQSAQPHGPYALFGVCVHGNLAIEVARQLQDRGENVAAVILKDVWEPAYGQRVSANRRTAMLDRLHFLRVRLRFLRRGDISLAAFLGMFSIFRRSGLLAAAVRIGLSDRVRNTDLDAEQEAFIAYLSAARNAHRPTPYDGTVLHFVTGESPSGAAFDPTMGWGDVVTGRLITEQLEDLSILRRDQSGIKAAAGKIEALLKACNSGEGVK